MKTFFALYAVLLATLWVGLFQETALKESIKRGNGIYLDFCVTCHMETGEGVPFTFPPLAKADFLTENRTGSLRAIKFGLQGEITVNGQTYNNNMAPLGLEDQEIADVMNYIGNSWGNTMEKMVTEEEVAAVRQ